MYEIKGVSEKGNYCVADSSSSTFMTKQELKLFLLNDIKVDGALLTGDGEVLIKRSVRANVLNEDDMELETAQVDEKAEEAYAENPNSVLAHMDTISLALDNGIFCSKRDVEELKNMLSELQGVESTEEIQNLTEKIEDTLSEIDDGATIEEVVSKDNFKPIPYELFANAKKDENGEWVWQDEADSQDDSTLTKLQSMLNDEQNKLIRDYIFYLSRRAFELNKGEVSINEITKKKIEKLKDIKKGGTWVYAGMVDYGYMGSSICPHCGARMSNTAVSKCCHDIVFTTSHKVRVLKDLKDSNGELLFPKGTVKAKSYIKEQLGRDLVDGEDFEVLYNRTYNGKCNKCGSTCACITRDAITSNKKNREKQHGIICSNCGKELVQQTHYTTFGDQVRYTHILWNIEDSDLETDFYGQLVNNSLEKVLESKKCIKFGLDNAAKMLGIAKGSLAYQALQLAQKASIEDIAELYAQLSSSSYKLNNNTEIDYYVTKTPDELMHNVGQNGLVGMQATIDFVNKLKLGNIKNNLMSGEDYTEIVEPKAIQMFDEFINKGLIPPRTLVLLIRDQFCGWKSHYFGNRTKNPETKELGKREFRWLGKDSQYAKYISNSITTYFGELKHLNNLINEELNTNMYNYLNMTQEKQGFTQKDMNYLYLYKNATALPALIRKYTEIYLQFLVCGIYAYTGKAPNTTEVYKNLAAFTDAYNAALRHIKSYFFDGLDFTPDYLVKLDDLLGYFEETKDTLPDYKIPIKHEDESGFYVDAKDSEYETLREYYKDLRQVSYLDKMGKLLQEFADSKGLTDFVDAFCIVYKMFYTKVLRFPSCNHRTIEDYKAAIEKAVNFVRDNAEDFNEFCIEKWQKQIDELNDEKRIQMAEETEKEKALELETSRMETRKAEAQNVKNASDLVAYLSDKDFSELPEYLSDKKPLSFHLSILDTVKKKGREPSSAQMYRLKTLFKDYTGVDYKPVEEEQDSAKPQSLKIEDIDNFSDFLDYFKEHKELLDSFEPITGKIIDSILKYKKVSPRQAVFIKDLPELYEQRTGIKVDLSKLL